MQHIFTIEKQMMKLENHTKMKMIIWSKIQLNKVHLFCNLFILKKSLASFIRY